MNTTKYDVGIIGAGIIGCCSAYQLVKRGLSVIVFDRGAIGTEASARNGGGVRQQNRASAEIPLAIASVKMWKELIAKFGPDYDAEYCQGGNIRVALSEADLIQAEQDIKRQAALGLEVILLNKRETLDRIPFLNEQLIFGSTFCPTDGQANPILGAKVWGRIAKESGVEFHECEAVTRVEEDIEGVAITTGKGAYSVKKVINAAGAWSFPIAEQMGVKLPARVEVSTIAVTEKTPKLFDEFVYREGFGYARQAKSGNIHIGAHVYEPYSITDRKVPWSVFPRYAKISELIPILEELHIIRSWSGFTTWTKDKTCIIDQVPGSKRMYLATGFSGHGFCMAPATGILIAEMVMGLPTSFALEPFRLNRF